MDDVLTRIKFAQRITVCTDSVENGIMRGRFYSGYYSEPFEFFGMSNLLLRMNALFDELAFPRLACELRGLAPHTDKKDGEGTRKSCEQCHTEQALGAFKGKHSTLTIQVHFRQNASWQGEFCWLEGHRSARFRSVLELMGMMTEVIEERGKTNDAI